MKKLLSILFLATLGTAAAKADSLSITFDQPNQDVVAGQTVEFFGTITNTGSDTLFLNSDDLSPLPSSFSVTDQFFSTVPVSLAPGTSAGDIELFDVTVNDPLLDPLGTYTGVYTLVGGTDGNAQDNLATAGFSVSPVPEPSTITLVLGGISAAWLPISRRLRKASV